MVPYLCTRYNETITKIGFSHTQKDGSKYANC
jgi:hypothetical protein